MDKNLPFIHPFYTNEVNLKEDDKLLEFLEKVLLKKDYEKVKKVFYIRKEVGMVNCVFQNG